MWQTQVVSRSLLDQPFIYGIAGTSITASAVVRNLLRYARRHDPIICAYRTMLELRHGAVGLPLLPATAAASILGQQQERGPLHTMYEQTQRNTVYLAVDKQPRQREPNTEIEHRQEKWVHFFD